MNVKKPITPYQRLLQDARDFARKIRYRHEQRMWFYSKVRHNSNGWRLDGLYERVSAAEQLGYEVHLRTDGVDLNVYYVKKIPEAPWAFRA